MRELQQKQKIKQRLYSLPVILVLAVLTVLIMKGSYAVVKKKQESYVYVADLQTKVQNLFERETELKSDIERLKTDEGIDSEIKKKYSVAKEGEFVVVIVDPKETEPEISSTTTPWYKRMMTRFESLW